MQVYMKLKSSLFASSQRNASGELKDETSNVLFCLVEWSVADPIEMMYFGVREERRDRII